jgi:hypothetical protein
MDRRVVEFLEKHYGPVIVKKDTGGNHQVECLHCIKQFWASKTRQRAHILKRERRDVAPQPCDQCSEEVREELTALETEIAGGGKQRPRVVVYPVRGRILSNRSQTPSTSTYKHTDGHDRSRKMWTCSQHGCSTNHTLPKSGISTFPYMFVLTPTIL